MTQQQPQSHQPSELFCDAFPIPPPLIKALSTSSAVLYLGAGASISAGLPSWEQFIRTCIARAKESSVSPSQSWTFLDTRVAQGDYLTAAELVQQSLGTQQLAQLFWDVFGKAQRPSEIHHAVARLPFSLAITTNFDLLLEAAYPSPAYPRPVVVHTWRDPDAFVSAIKHSRFAVVKTHGVAGNGPSLVLTRNQYRNLIHTNDAFNSCLRTLLSLKTFLFVGASLRDQDLLKLMDEARLLYGPEFGPHYAILFDDELDDNFITFLEQSYAITVIVCRRPPGELLNDKYWTEMAERRESACKIILRAISGKAGLARHAALPLPNLDNALFYRREACASLLAAAIELTGSFRGEICFIKSDNRHFLRREAVSTIPDGMPASATAKVRLRMPQIGPYSVIASLFVKGRVSEDFVYLADVRMPQKVQLSLVQQGLFDAKYKACHPDVRSELACTIMSDGKRVGVINVESKLLDAYSRDHLTVLQKLADQAGWIYSEARQRQRCSRGLLAYFRHPDRFRALLEMNRELKHLDMRFILWESDYVLGRLVAHSDHLPTDCTRSQDFFYRFEDRSLATTVFRDRRREFIQDAAKELENGENSLLASQGCKAFDVHGPVVALPVQRDGHTSAVLVAWSNAIPSEDKVQQCENTTIFERDVSERIHRTAHLIANDLRYYPVTGGDRETMKSSRADAFIRYINDQCEVYDNGEAWRMRKLSDGTFRRNITDVLLNALLQPCCGLLRVRLWAQRFGDAKIRFECIRSKTVPGKSTVMGKSAENEYIGKLGKRDDPYVRYTCIRYENDPYAHHQHWTMFGQPDANCEDLDKDRDGSWIVGPVVRTTGKRRRRVLLGFLSADMHRPVKLERDGVSLQVMKERRVKPRLQVFQRYAVDVVTELLAFVWTYDTWEPIAATQDYSI
jgi:GAF domain-containing protein